MGSRIASRRAPFPRARRVLRRAIEKLEDRRLLSTYFVNMTGQAFEDVPGYMTDIGAGYGDRGDRGNPGVEYGWINSSTGAPVDNGANARNRNNGNVPPSPQTPINEIYDSFNHLQKQTPAYSWEIAIPNGFYNVHIGSGDPTAVDSRFQMRVEGAQVYDASPVAPNYWVEGSVAVNVTDGKLTVGVGPNATNAKLNFVEISSVDTAPDQAPVLTALPASSKVSLSWNTVPKTATYNLFRGTTPGNATLYQSGLTGTTYNDTAVTVGTTYYYHLVPVNPVGSGPQSNQVNYRVSSPYAHVNFQPGTTANPTPAGYLKDSGDAFSNRGNGFSYGWWNAADNVTPAPTANASTRERLSTNSPDQRYDTLLQLDKAGESPATGPVWWEVNVPNGTYLVRVVAGDPANADEFLSFIAEANKDANGVPQVDGSGLSLIHYDANGQTGLARFADSGFMEVTVVDGNLTISEGPDAANNKICFIDIDTLTVAAKPADPTALSITNVRASQLTLNWNDASADETEFRIEQSADGISFAPLATAPSHTGTGPVSFVVPGLAPTTHYYYRVYAVNLQGDSTNPTNIADATTSVVTGGLAGRVNPTTGDVDLSAEGALDWAHWGSLAADTFEHKSGVTPLISNATPVGASSKVQLTNSPTTFSWTDGTVSPSLAGTPNTLGTFAWGHGFTFTVPADTTVRALRVYVGVNNLRGQILARLSDGSAPDYVDSSITSAALADGVYTLVYSAASAGQTLSVTWIELPNNGNQIDGRLSLKAATLQIPPATLGTAESVAAKPLSSGRVHLTWADAATNDFGYFVERAPSVAGAPGTYARVGQVATGATSFLDNSTIGVASTSYFYRLVPYNVALAGGTASPAVAVTTVTGPFGDGALATYYDAPDLAGGNDPALGTPWPTTSIDPNINFDFTTTAPAGAGAGFGADTFLIRWSAKVKPEFTGDYVFTAEADDGYRLWVNGTLVLDNLSRRGGLGTFFDSTPVTLIAGKSYDIVFDVADNTGNAGARLYWSTAGLPREIIPQAALFHADPDQIVAPKVTGIAVDDRLPVTAPPDNRQQIAVRFSENVGIFIDGSDFTVQSLAPGGPTYDSSSFFVTWDAPSNSAILYFTGLPNNLLPDGHYRLTVSAAGVSDNFFNSLDGDNDNTPGGDYVGDFFVFTGDANHDGSINFNDLVTLAQNYNTTGKAYADGDFNHDGAVDFNDLVLLAQRYNTTLAPPPAPAPVASARQLVSVTAAPATATTSQDAPTPPPATRPAARPGTRPASKPAAVPPPPPPPAPPRTFATRKITATDELLTS